MSFNNPLKNVFHHLQKTFYASFILFFLIINIQFLYALDVIKIGKPQSEKDAREQYNYVLLKTLLDKTVSEFGEYKVKLTMPMMRNRGLTELIEGKIINVYIAPTQPEWEKNAIPVYFPLRKGIMGYRLFLIKRRNTFKFKVIESIEDLKELKAGLAAQWSIVKALEPQGFNIVKGSTYEGLFKMLNSERFDYFPRGIDEIFPEYEMRKDELPEMVIEQTKALYLHLPIYFFVSPRTPVLAKRIDTGLWIMKKDGSFDELFLKYFKNSISKANLKNRRIFRINNPTLKKNEIFKRGELWFNPN